MGWVEDGETAGTTGRHLRLEAVNLTIAKGDDRCVFEFFRKGTAPDNAHLNK